jgi:streptomycin 6-kinase
MTAIEVPTSLSWWQGMPGGADWLGRLPRLAAECAEQWRLTLERPFEASNASLVVPAGDVVLKINPPDEESEHEAEALRLWDGDGAVRLLAHDPERRALLLERCDPGTLLLELDDDGAAGVVAALLPRLWQPPPSDFRRLETVAARWVEELPRTWEEYGRPFDRILLDAAVGALRELGPTQGPLVAANEDLHAGNVLRSRREPWLVVDPKPLAGERAFTPVPMVRDRKEDMLGGPRPRRRLRRRLDRFSSDLELDRERVRGWTVAHTLAWGFGPHGAIPAHVELVRLLLEI